MTQQKTRIISFILRFSGAVLSVLVAIFLLLQVVVWGGVYWLQTAKGQLWLSSSLAALAEGTGYIVEIEDMNGLTWAGVNVASLKIADQHGPLAQADNIRIRINFLSLVTRGVSASFQAEKFEMARMPSQQSPSGEDAQAGKTALSLPDLYFTHAAIDRLKIERLVVPASVAGVDIDMPVDLSLSARRKGEEINIETSGVFTKHPYLPERIKASAVVHLAALQADDVVIDIMSDFYNLRFKGQALLEEKYPFTFDVEGVVPDLSVLSPQLPHGDIKVEGDISGTSEAVKADIKGAAALQDYVAAGLSPVSFALSVADDMTGRAEIKASYQQREITAAADFSYAEPFLKLADIEVHAPDAMARGAVDIDTSRMLASGNINFSVLAERYKDLHGIDAAGRITADITLASARERQMLKVRADMLAPRYQDITADKISLDAELADIQEGMPSRANLSVQRLRAGDAWLDDGSLVLAKDAKAQDYIATLKGSGGYIQPLRFSGQARVGSDRIGDISLDVLPSKGVMKIAGGISRENADLSIHVKNMPLSALPLDMPDAARDVTAQGNIFLSGALASPVIKTDIKLSPLQPVQDFSSINIALSGGYNAGKVLAEMSVTGQGIETLSGKAELPLEISLSPLRVSDVTSASLTGHINGRLETDYLSRAFLPSGTDLSGKLHAVIGIAGTIVQPIWSGSLMMTDGAFSQGNITLDRISAQIDLDQESLRLFRFAAVDGGGKGRLSASGTIGYARESRPADISLKVDDFSLFQGVDTISGLVSGDLKLTGQQGAYLIEGKVSSDRLDIAIPERIDDDIPCLNIVKSFKDKHEEDTLMKSVSLRVKAVASNQVFVRGWGLDAEFGGDIAVEGTLAAPVFNGTLESRRGRYEEFGKRFDLAHAYLRFQGAVPPSPYLDILAESKSGDITAQINLSGSVEKPSITFSSIPSLPQDEVLSRLLFGKELTKISPFQAIQLANTLRRFSGNGGGAGIDPLGLLRRVTGLDDLQVENDGQGGTTVGVGKYINDKVYLEAQAGSGENSGAAKIKVDVTPNIKAESRIGQDAEAGGGIFWEWDY